MNKGVRGGSKHTSTKTTTRGGLDYRNGQFEIRAMEYATGRRVIPVEGKVTEYNGTEYGVRGQSGDYAVTHIPTGLRVSNGKTIKTLDEVSRFIKEVDVKVQGDKARIDKLAEEFQRQRKEAGII